MRKVLIVGGGFGGVYAGLRLEKRAKRGEIDLTVVSPQSYMTYQPFLPEAASGTLEPRHVAVPLRGVLKGARLITGFVDDLDHARRVARVRPVEGDPYEVAYDDVIVTVGSVSRTLDIPGLDDHGIGFKSIEEAIHLRNHVISQMDEAESTSDPELRRRSLTFVFVGGGYAGAEALAELEDLARSASRRYRTITRADMRWILVEASDTILSEMAHDAGRYSVGILRGRDIEVKLETTLVSVEGGNVRLSDGGDFPADTVVWTAGVRADRVVSRFGFETDGRGSLVVDEFLRVKGVDGAWAVGDCAAVPDAHAGGKSPPTAQHAVRQARLVADNVLATHRGADPKPFRYRMLGSVASLGRYKGVATIFGLRFRGITAWFMHRTYHLFALPTFNRKVRVALDWTVDLFFGRDVVQLGSLQRPRDPFKKAFGADGEPPPDPGAR